MDNELKSTIIKELGIGNLPEDAQDQILGSLGELILKNSTTAIFEVLTPEQQEMFDHVSEEGDPEKIQQFLAEHVPNIQEITSRETRAIIEQFKAKE